METESDSKREGSTDREVAIEIKIEGGRRKKREVRGIE